MLTNNFNQKIKYELHYKGLHITHIAWRKLMAVPENIGFNHIYPTFLRCLNKTRPHLPQTHHLLENCEVPDGRNKRRGAVSPQERFEGNEWKQR